MRHFAGIDSGTQSTKVLVLDDGGRVVGRGSAAHDLIDGLPPGHKEQHPHTWADAMRAAFRDALREANVSPRDIAGVGVSGQQHGFVALDARDRVLRPAKLWCDTSTAAECGEIADAVGGPAEYARLTGNALPPGFTASKIAWMKKREPENFALLATVLLPHDWLNFRLTGEKRMEWGDASGTGLMDVRRRAWCGPVVDAIDGKLMRALPELSDSAEACGFARGDLARELGLSETCVVSAGGGDNMMGAIGTGNVRAGVVTVSLGTSGTVYACSDAPVVDPRGEIAAFCDSTGKWLPLLCTMNVTVATELVRELFSADVARLNELAASVPAGADGLMLLPYFEGERTPNVPDGTGTWFGFRAGTATPAHFARAAMEGATLGLGYGFARMRELGIRPSEIRLTGGGSKSALWRSICADVFATPVVCTREAEGAALGAAIQARWCVERRADPRVGIAAIVREWVALDESTRCEPDAARSELYARLQSVHDEWSRALRGAFGAHRRLLA